MEEPGVEDAFKGYAEVVDDLGEGVGWIVEGILEVLEELERLEGFDESVEISRFEDGFETGVVERFEEVFEGVFEKEFEEAFDEIRVLD